MRYIASLEIDNKEIIAGNKCITSITELYQCILYPDITEVVITKSFANEFFTPSGLTHFVENAQSLNSRLTVNVDGTMSMFDERAVKELKSLKNVDEFIFALHRKPVEILDTIQALCAAYNTTSKETLVANNKVSTLHLQNTSMLNHIRDLEEDKTRILDTKNEFESKFQTIVSRINYKYDKDIKPESMFQVTGSRYDKILYIQEITRVHYVDTLIYYIQELLKTLYNVPARLVVIEPSYAYGRARLYPNCKPQYSLTYNDVYTEDIFMAGMQAKLMQDILKNPSSMNYLIVLDRSGYDVPHITGDKVEVVYCASDERDTDGLGLPLDRIISYSEATMYIPFIPGFKLISVEERMQKYSSMTIMKKLIELIERR